MFNKVALILLATFLLAGCQAVSDQELKVLQARADKAGQQQTENSQLKLAQTALIETIKELNHQLEQEVANKQVSIKEVTIKDATTNQVNGTGIIKVTLQQNILFSSSSYKIDQAGAADILRKVASSLNNNGGVKLRIVGHTDNLPVAKKIRNQFSDNWDLSSRRAGEVARFLIWGAGFPRENITVVGRAEVEPVASNKTKKGRAANRRIELFIKN